MQDCVVQWFEPPTLRLVSQKDNMDLVYDAVLRPSSSAVVWFTCSSRALLFWVSLQMQIFVWKKKECCLCLVSFAQLVFRKRKTFLRLSIGILQTQAKWVYLFVNGSLIARKKNLLLVGNKMFNGGLTSQFNGFLAHAYRPAGLTQLDMFDTVPKLHPEETQKKSTFDQFNKISRSTPTMLSINVKIFVEPFLIKVLPWKNFYDLIYYFCHFQVIKCV